MEPTLKKGMRLNVSPSTDTLTPGNIIVYTRKNKIIAHRIVRQAVINGSTFFLVKGDNNELMDGWIQKKDIIGKIYEANATSKKTWYQMLPPFFARILTHYQNRSAIWIDHLGLGFLKIVLLYALGALLVLLFKYAGIVFMSIFSAYLVYSIMRYGYYRRLTTAVVGKFSAEVRDHIYPLSRHKNIRDVYLPVKHVTYSRAYIHSHQWAMFQELYPFLQGLQKLNKVLILGFGAGGIACQLLRSFPNIKITGVDIDGTILDIAKKFFLPLCVNGNSVTLKKADAFQLVKKINTQFDVIFLDILHDALLESSVGIDAFTSSLLRIRAQGGVIIINFGILNRTTMAPAIRTYLKTQNDMQLFLMGHNIVGIITSKSKRYLTQACGTPII